MTAIRDALTSALSIDDRARRVSQLHTVIANALHKVAPETTFRTTDYFNHSFVPDLALEWGTPEGQVQREVFLRFGLDNPAFQDDVAILGPSEHPLFIGLGEEEPSDATIQQLHQTGTLAAPAASLEPLAESTKASSTGKSASSAIVRAGHGAVTVPRAEVLRRATQSLAAEDGGAAPDEFEQSASQVLGQARELLPEAETLRLEQVLLSDWIASGRDPQTYPGSVQWRPETLDHSSLREALRAMLSSPFPITAGTWTTCLGHLTADQFGVLMQDVSPGTKLATAMEAMLPQWTAKWLWGERQEPTFVESSNWFVRESLLGFDGPELRVYFSDDGRHFKNKPPVGQPPRLSSAKKLLSKPDVLTVVLESRDERFYWERKDGEHIAFSRLGELLLYADVADFAVRYVRVQTPDADYTVEIDLHRLVIDSRDHGVGLSTFRDLAFRFFGPGDEGE